MARRDRVESLENRGPRLRIGWRESAPRDLVLGDDVTTGNSCPTLFDLAHRRRVREDCHRLFDGLQIVCSEYNSVSTDVLDEYGDQLRNDLNELSAMITTDNLLVRNTETDIAKREPDDLAAEWLEAKTLSQGKAAAYAPERAAGARCVAATEVAARRLGHAAIGRRGARRPERNRR